MQNNEKGTELALLYCWKLVDIYFLSDIKQNCAANGD